MFWALSAAQATDACLKASGESFCLEVSIQGTAPLLHVTKYIHHNFLDREIIRCHGTGDLAIDNIQAGLVLMQQTSHEE